MRKALVLVVAAVVLLLGAWWIYGKRDVSRAVREPWPEGLGTLASVPDRFPPQGRNEAARRLTELAVPLGIPFTASRDFSDTSGGPGAYGSIARSLTGHVRNEMAQSQRAIAAPPADVAAFLTNHAADIDALRAHLLGETIAWQRDISAGRSAPIPNLMGHMALARVLVANALLRARGGDIGAWDDLRAAWHLTRALDAHPEMITQLIALAMARMINAAAWRMPLPEPAWRRQMDEVDADRQLRRSLQYEKWSLWMNTKAKPGELAEVIDREREIAEQLAAVTACDFDATKLYRDLPAPSLVAMWRRAFRYRAEREATRNALALARGEAVPPQSRCSDGGWVVEGQALRFTREIPASGSQESVMPLRLSL